METANGGKAAKSPTTHIVINKMWATILTGLTLFLVTGSISGALVVYTKVERVEVLVDQHERKLEDLPDRDDLINLRDRQADQYAEIIRRLDRMQDQLDRSTPNR